jgi:hypothetical protein
MNIKDSVRPRFFSMSNVKMIFTNSNGRPMGTQKLAPHGTLSVLNQKSPQGNSKSLSHRTSVFGNPQKDSNLFPGCYRL